MTFNLHQNQEEFKLSTFELESVVAQLKAKLNNEIFQHKLQQEKLNEEILSKQTQIDDKETEI